MPFLFGRRQLIWQDSCTHANIQFQCYQFLGIPMISGLLWQIQINISFLMQDFFFCFAGQWPLFRFSKVHYLKLLLCSIHWQPSSVSIYHLLCLNTACSSVFCLFIKGKHTILKVMTKSLHGGNLIFLIKVGVHYWKLSKSKLYHLLLQPHHHSHGHSFVPELITSFLIMSAGWPGWVWAFIYFQYKVVWLQKSSPAI